MERDDTPTEQQRKRERTRSVPRGGHEQTAMSERMGEGVEKAPNQSSSNFGSARTGVNHKKRNADAEHAEDIEREHEKAVESRMDEEEGGR